MIYPESALAAWWLLNVLVLKTKAQGGYANVIVASP
jgi:hypothetical protein